MKSTAVAVLLVSLAVGGFAQDPAKVGAGIYNCTFENERVRLCEVVFKPGAEVALHSHPAHLVYVIAPGKLRITPKEGKPVEVDFQVGQVFWSEPDTHSAVNIGTTELRGVLVELKDTRPMTQKK